MHVRARARVLVVTRLECEIEPCTHRYGDELSAQTRRNGGAFFCSLLARRRRLRALACHLPLMTS